MAWHENLPSVKADLERSVGPGQDQEFMEGLLEENDNSPESNRSYALAAKLRALQHTGSRLTLIRHLRGVKE